MALFESPRKKLLRRIRILLPILFLALLCLVFWVGISRTSSDTLAKEQQTLEQALRNGAVHAYALSGRYPESLDVLLSDYHITYDRSRFVVEYVPSGSNLFPMISVIPLSGKTGGRL